MLKTPDMKKLDVLFLIFFLSVFMACKETDVQEISTKHQNSDSSVFDSLLAQKYGADDYGMRKYVMAFLKRGPNRERSTEESKKLQAAHIENIGRMAEEGKLVLAGPFFEDGELRGIYIFNVNSIEEAEALTNTDPAIQAGSLIMELKEWYGSAGLMGVNDLHKKLAKKEM